MPGEDQALDALASAVASVQSRSGRACFVGHLKEPYPTTAKLLPIELQKGQQDFGLRVTTEVKLDSGHTMRSYGDTYVFVVGPAEILFGATSTYHPPSAATEGRLLSLLDDRGETHKL